MRVPISPCEHEPKHARGMCVSCYRKDRYKNGKRRGYHYQTAYGITLEEYEAMLERQGGVCAVCGGVSTKGRRLSLDHDHRTGRIRGLLCNHCNVALGQAGDSPERLRALADYVESNSKLPE